MINIAVISGTTRPKSKSKHIAKYLSEYLAKTDDVGVKLVSTSDYDLSLDGNDEENKIADYTELVKWADGLVVVTPEYNHSFPGSLKSLLDKELAAYNHKAVGVVGVSSGVFGGARVIENILPIFRELGLTISHTALHIQSVGSLVDESGKVDDTNIVENVEKFVKELLWVSKTLKWGRENLN